MSEQTPDPYGQPSPYGQQPSAYGQQPAYGAPHPPASDRRPGTVTAAAWITIVLSVLTAAIFGLMGLAVLVAQDQVVTELERVPEFQDANIDADAAVGVLVAVTLGLVVWCLVAIVVAVLVLRRSSVARILLVISASVTVVVSLLGLSSGVTLVTLIAAIATIVLLFTGGAGAWFNRTGTGDQPQGGSYGDPYPYPSQPAAAPQYPSSDDTYGRSSGPNPYGQQSSPGADNPYGQQPPTEGGGPDHPREDPYR